MQRVNLVNKSHIDAAKADEYATSEDFRKLFTEDMTGLYLLSLLLTANHEKAEQCFVAGVEDSVEGNPVFKEWARSWAKRTIINNAIKIMAPHPNRVSGTFAGMPPEAGGGLQRTQDHQATIASVLALEDFDRFVFVMSVLEQYPDKEGSDLLGCSEQDVREARMRALQQIAEYTKHEVTESKLSEEMQHG